MTLPDFHRLDPSYDAGDPCPVHGTPHRKTYTFGSTLSGETDVSMFRGCQCATAIRHDPVGTLRSTASYHTSYAGAAGVGTLHKMEMAAKYR